MKKSDALKQDLAGLKKEYTDKLDKIQALEDNAQDEKRSLTSDEKKESDKLMKEVEDFDFDSKRASLDQDIKRALMLENRDAERAAEKAAKAIGDHSAVSDSERSDMDKTIKRASLGKAVLSVINKDKFDGAELEMHQEGAAELRRCGLEPQGFTISRAFLDRVEKRTDIDENTAASTSTDLDGYAKAIRANAVYNKVGINFRQAVGNVKTNIVTAMNWGWVAAENTAATDIGANPTSVTASPKWARGYVDISKTHLAQNPGAMAEYMYDLGVAEANIFDTALFSTTSVSNAPTAIAATSNVLTFTEASYSANASVFSDFIEAIQTLGENDAATDQMRFIAAPILFGELFKSPQVAAVSQGLNGQTYSGNTIAGYPVHFTTAATNATATGDVVAGDFAMGVKAYQWGGLDLFIDPYSVSLNDQVRIVGHKRVDWVVPQGGRFVKFTSPVA
jgi:hypothetical protein